MSRRRPDREAPPELAGRILDLLELPGDAGTLRGDLDEEYVRHVLPERGWRGARVWYWRQTLASAPSLIVRRHRGLRPTPEGWRQRRLTDLRYAIRALARRPGTTMAAAATIALALAANIAVFSVVWAVLLRPLPYAHADRLVRIHPDELFYTELDGARRFAEHATAFDAIVPWGRTLFTFTGDGVSEEARGALVAWDHFDMLGARPVLGRSFRRGDAESWPYGSIILAHDLWVRRYGEDPTVVGRRVDVGGRLSTVVGVMGPEHVPVEPDWQAWAPLPLDATLMEGRGLAMNARLAPGITLETATADSRRAFAESWAVEGYAATSEDLAGVRVVPLRDHLLGDATRPLQILMGAVLGILLLACANVAHLLLAQGEGRAAEIAVRLALGATRRRIGAQLLLETALTATVGCVAGLWVAWLGVSWVSSRLPTSLPRTDALMVGGPALAFGMAATALVVALSGIYPALRAASTSLRDDLMRAGRGGPRGGRAAPLLVGLEVGTAVLLVVWAGLFLRTLGALAAVDPGFDPAGVIAVRVSPPPGRYDGPDAHSVLYDRIHREVSALPGVTSAGAIMFLPMTSGGAWSRYRATPEPPADPADAPSSSFRIVTPGYFETLGIRVSRGRTFDDRDRADAPEVALVNQTAARMLFPDEDPVGRRLYQGEDASTYRTVIGVVSDVRQTNLRHASFPEIYLPLGQNDFARLYVLARATGDPGRTLDAVVTTILGIDEGLILSRAATVEDIVGATVADTRLLAQLLTLFGLVALALGAVGVYGVTAHGVSRRRREIGIRLALGADGPSVASRLIARGMVPVLVGLIAGIAAATLVSRLLAGLLFEVAPLDAVTFLTAPILLTTTALVALAVPASRAGRLDPVQTLREE